MRCQDCGRVMKEVKEDYRFTESGLDNVYLSGIPVFKCSCGATTAKIPRMKELLDTIGETIINKIAPLTGKEVRYLRKHAGLSAVAFAHYLNVDPSTLSRWEKSKRHVGKNSDLLIRLCYASLMEYQNSRQILEVFLSLREKEDRKIQVKPSTRKGYQAAYV